ncbi:MAG: PadR family transcriptional regulator [Candidatus Taylorbacteria bacterium]|nr:PadR family transcriptional regulator [Candidatus Taylorbacteria bacterium]
MKVTTTSQRFSQLRRGFIEFAILKLIHSNPHTFYGKEIFHCLAKTEFAAPKGTLYYLLSKMRHEKTILSSSEEDDYMGRHKYYYLTKKGKNILHELDVYWQILNKNLDQISQPLSAEEHSELDNLNTHVV